MADREHGVLIGATLVTPRAGEILGELVLAIKLGTPLPTKARLESRDVLLDGSAADPTPPTRSPSTVTGAQPFIAQYRPPGTVISGKRSLPGRTSGSRSAVRIPTRAEVYALRSESSIEKADAPLMRCLGMTLPCVSMMHTATGTAACDAAVGDRLCESKQVHDDCPLLPRRTRQRLMRPR
ncbi:MAG: hypothetical protein ABJA98_33795 [Acidobacteriota bacterium]